MDTTWLPPTSRKIARRTRHETRRVYKGARRRAGRVARRYGLRPAPAASQQGVSAVRKAPDRRDLVLAHIDLAGHGLEIGASHRPLVAKRHGYDVKVADHLDAAGLIEKYTAHPNVDTSGIEEVDFVLSGPSMSAGIDDTFDYIVASHVLEHSVCMVSFLRDCEALLKPGGVVAFALPDRRWCFDRFRERASLGRVIDASYSSAQVHTPGTLAEFRMSVVSRGDKISWLPTSAPGEYKFVHDLASARGGLAEAADGVYRDVHNWVFTPNHFRLLIADLHALGFIELQEVAFHETVGMEFFITLGLHGQGPDVPRAELLVRSDEERDRPDAPRFAALEPGP